MERIIIIGCGGSGKSTLARKLGELLQLPVIHLDKLWWRPGWEHISQEEFDQCLQKEMDKPQWIMDGNFDRTLSQRLQRCDTVIWLRFPRLACMCGVLKRIFTTYGTVRPDMGEGCPERLDWEFLKWVWNFNREHDAKYCRLLSEMDSGKVYILKNRREVNRFLQELKQ